jgi:hypothetical protein
MADSPAPKPSPAKPAVPAPGSLPKLPQTIFNLEKRSGDPGKDSSTRSRPRP